MNSTGTVIEGRGKTLGELMAPSPERAGFCVRLDNTLRELDYLIPSFHPPPSFLFHSLPPPPIHVYACSFTYLPPFAFALLRPHL